MTTKADLFPVAGATWGEFTAGYELREECDIMLRQPPLTREGDRQKKRGLSSDDAVVRYAG